MVQGSLGFQEVPYTLVDQEVLALGRVEGMGVVVVVGVEEVGHSMMVCRLEHMWPDIQEHMALHYASQRSLVHRPLLLLS